ncbi:MAG: helix-turn-helix domain-containing protein [Sarcina sp.]
MLSQRIKEIRKFNNLSQSKFGELLGVGRDVIGNIEYNRVEPKALLLNHLCNVFNINKEWLETGNGDMHNIPLDKIKTADLMVKLKNSNPNTAILIEKILSLPEEDQSLIIAMVDNMLSKSK